MGRECLCVRVCLCAWGRDGWQELAKKDNHWESEWDHVAIVVWPSSRQMMPMERTTGIAIAKRVTTSRTHKAQNWGICSQSFLSVSPTSKALRVSWSIRRPRRDRVEREASCETKKEQWSVARCELVSPLDLTEMAATRQTRSRETMRNAPTCMLHSPGSVWSESPSSIWRSRWRRWRWKTMPNSW